MAVFIALTFGKVFYRWRGGSSVVLCLPVLSRFWRRDLPVTRCGAGAVSHGVPRQRLRFLHLLARFGGAGITFSGWRWRQHFQSLGIPVALTSIAFAIGLLLIPFGAETRGRLCRRSLTEKAKKHAEVETKVFTIEALRDFSTRMFLHFGVPKYDAAQAPKSLPPRTCAVLPHGVARLHSYFDMLTWAASIQA